MQDIATDKELGFSMLGGQGISSGQRSQSGYFGSSCLDSMMSGTRDMLFKPPGLSSLLSQLGSMFGGGGGGGGGGCGNAPSIMNQIAGSFPSGSFGAGNGGFFPYIGNGSAEEGGGSRGFTNGFGLSQMVGQTSIARQPASLTSLFSR